MKGELGGTLPIPASQLAQSWDNLYLFLFGVCVFFFVLVVAAMVVFIIKYRKQAGRQAAHITHHTGLEVMWTIIPTFLVLVIFVWGWIVYRDMHLNVPADAMEVKVVAQSWSWTFQYEDGRTLTNELVVPQNKPVKLLITSKLNDVLHSLYIPNLRIKKDAVPGMYTTLWFAANVVGVHQIFCAEYCGTSHSNMLAKLIVLDPEQWEIWKWGGKIQMPPVVGVGGMAIPTELSAADTSKNLGTSLAEEGKRLVQVKGCVACHSDDGSKRIGPSYKGIFGHEVELSNGTKVMVDENYIRESILTPQAKIVKGFENLIMPPYAGQFDEKELNAVIDYIKSVK